MNITIGPQQIDHRTMKICNKYAPNPHVFELSCCSPGWSHAGFRKSASDARGPSIPTSVKGSQESLTIQCTRVPFEEPQKCHVLGVRIDKSTGDAVASSYWSDLGVQGVGAHVNSPHLRSLSRAKEEAARCLRLFPPLFTPKTLVFFGGGNKKKPSIRFESSPSTLLGCRDAGPEADQGRRSHMFRRMRYLIGLNPKTPPTKRLLDERPRRVKFQPPDMLETVHEIAIYIHRFHNLDLFQQGWYQIKISARWEDSSLHSCGTPSRVIQYEAPNTVSDDLLGVWRIDDADHSFSTQPFKIKYARQDVPLSVMKPLISAVILKFELMYAPILENGHEIQASFDMIPVAVHEFKIPPRALLGLHAYCPVHFDAFHAVLVDLSVHIVYLKAGASTREKLLSASVTMEHIADEYHEEHNQLVGQGWSSKAVEIIKSLLVSRELLLEEIKNLSKALGQSIDDLQFADLNLGRFEFIDSSLSNDLSTANSVISGSKVGVGHLAGMLQNILEKSNGTVDFGNDVIFYSLSKDELLDLFFTLGNQLSFLWNTFLKFHRVNRISILEHLHGVWALNREAEWSIWLVYSKIEVPHHYMRSGADDPSHHGKVVGLRKSSDEPAQSATTRAELHRKSIAQMKINSHTIQDMHIFGDPSRVPVVLVEQKVIDLPNNSAWQSLNQNTAAIPTAFGKNGVPRFTLEPKRSNRVLRAVGHHLDLRLVRNQWLLIDPGAECLMSEANEEKTTGDFREMGSRLAEEVITFLRKKMDRLSRYGGCKDIKLSFVGHSIGNIIIRSALTESVMGPFLKHLYTYISISGPHLGYWYSSNSLFNSGLWLMKKLKGAQCIHQLTFTDDPDLQNTFFYKLCKQKTLENFKNIILLSSPQDGYVPYHSARIESCPASSWDQSRKAHIFMEMLNNCLDQIHAPSSERRVLMRCDVNFDTSSQGRNLNTFIGRAAHIEFLETDMFAKFIMWSFPDFFL
ncbi:serine esterase family protein [Musa troglodytarum]|uniref:Serine esterase family protein n=1 Tax=Musa troglodytarum TaxID=320322 RepID=A0A9E7H7E4_9LILI|nr:serine esterase family protein [Musa troglodytarum]URE28172.1 serine esterase family protein [Musa troglodytarum]